MTDDRSATGECHVCGEEKPLDGEHATVRFGEVLCRECSDESVVFVARCTSGVCSWSYRVDGREFNRGHLKTRVQQEANNHEAETRLFDDEPMHSVEWREVTEARA